jgi:hypothetical protein
MSSTTVVKTISILQEYGVKLTPVESDAIAKIGYDRQRSKLFIVFKLRPIKLLPQYAEQYAYVYNNVEPEVFIDFLNSSSHGLYYNQSIKGKYEDVSRLCL